MVFKIANLSVLMVKEVEGGRVEELKDLLMPAGVLHQVHQGGVSRHTPKFKKYVILGRPVAKWTR